MDGLSGASLAYAGGGMSLEDYMAQTPMTIGSPQQVIDRTLGFREFVGYDHDRFTLLRGDFPAPSVPRLLKDLRTEPTGWFLPDTMPRLSGMRGKWPTPDRCCDGRPENCQPRRASLLPLLSSEQAGKSVSERCAYQPA